MHLCSRTTICRVSAVIFLLLTALWAMPVPGQQVALVRPTVSSQQLTTDQEQILARAREILKKAAVSDAEQGIRLQILKAAMTGTVIRSDDDNPETRNPKYWTLSGEAPNDAFVVAAESMPVKAIADLWVVHNNDGVPIPRIRCYPYSTLILIEGYIQYFRETSNTAGLAALNRLIGHRRIPKGLPNGGDDLLWKRRLGGDNLLPGDQAWFDNPFFDRGRVLMREELYQQAIREGQSPKNAAALAKTSIESLTAGEEGSNVFYIGDDKFIRTGSSLSRICRDVFQRPENGSVAAHEQVLTPKILTFARYQQHMIDDNYTAQACMRASPADVRPEDFKIERVRSPMGPENLLRLYADPIGSTSFDSLIDAMASHNKPPRLVTVGDVTIPLFDAAFDWSEQQRVRTAVDAVMRTKSDDFWWRLRANIHDDRYVLTATRGKAAKNFTVGRCARISSMRSSAGAFLPTCLGCPGDCPRRSGRRSNSGRTSPSGPANGSRSMRCRPSCANGRSSSGSRSTEHCRAAMASRTRIRPTKRLGIPWP